VALAFEKLGTRYEARTATIDLDRARAYAAATNDPNPLYASGRYAPPVFAVVPTWDAMMVALHDVVPADDQVSMLHAEQDMHFLRPLVPGQVLITSAEAYGIRTGRTGTRFTMRVVSHDRGGKPVIEQFATMLIRGVDGSADGGAVPPDHAFSTGARSGHDPLAMVRTVVDADQATRYAAASGDANPIHVDDDAAKAVGLPGVILHGMCTMALCGRSILDAVGDSDPTRLRRLAVRFYRPVFPGHDLTNSIYGTDEQVTAGPGTRTYAFEATSAGKVVVRDGRAEIGVPAASGEGDDN